MTSNGAVFFSPPSTPLDSLQLPENDPDPEDVAAESTSRIVKSVSAVSELVSCHPHVFFFQSWWMKHHSIFWICSTLARIESDGIPVYNYHCWDALLSTTYDWAHRSHFFKP